jgi:hypothetical protein
MKNFTRIFDTLGHFKFYQGIFILKIDNQELKFKSGKSTDGNVTFISFFEKPDDGRGRYNYLGIITRHNDFFVTQASKYHGDQNHFFIKLFKMFWKVCKHTGSAPDAVECYIKS